MITPLANPAAYDLPAVKDLFERAFAGDRPVAPEVARHELQVLAGSPRVKVLVGRDGTRYASLAVILLPTHPLAPLPQVYHFFNDGPVTLRHEMVDAVVETVKAAGYNSLQALNGNGLPEDVWTRLFRRAGELKPIGLAYQIDIK